MTGFVKRTLPELVAQIPGPIEMFGDLPPADITGIVFDSRAVQPGVIFVALVGGSQDGHRYIPDAVQAGATAVVGNVPMIADLTVPYIRVEDTRKTLAYLAAAFYDFPARNLTMIGITGTDGKTTTANMLFQILLAAQYRAGIISTINAVIGDEILDTGFHVTTPESPEVQKYLARMLTAGITHVVLEATSHGLDQHRVSACEFDIGIVTNITHEHLDYHGTYEAYRMAKSRLFTSLSETSEKFHRNPRIAILNRDDQSYEYLKNVTMVRQVSYGLSHEADVHAEEILYRPSGLRFMAVSKDFQVPIEACLVGDFNISNALAAFTAAVYGLNIAPDVAARGIGLLNVVPGRMERIDLGQSFFAIVDFAHTPNALKNALHTARKISDRRIIAVFGSAGLRDREKRRLMAAESLKHADITILTAEDPRTENLDNILEEMSDEAIRNGGVKGQNFYCIADRGNAIRAALRLAAPGDIVIACGKGHEQSMCFGTVEYHWDDRIAMRAGLAELLNIPGPEMPHLPTSDKEG